MYQTLSLNVDDNWKILAALCVWYEKLESFDLIGKKNKEKGCFHQTGSVTLKTLVTCRCCRPAENFIEIVPCVHKWGCIQCIQSTLHRVVYVARSLVLSALLGTCLSNKQREFSAFSLEKPVAHFALVLRSKICRAYVHQPELESLCWRGFVGSVTKHIASFLFFVLSTKVTRAVGRQDEWW